MPVHMDLEALGKMLAGVNDRLASVEASIAGLMEGPLREAPLLSAPAHNELMSSIEAQLAGIPELINKGVTDATSDFQNVLPALEARLTAIEARLVAVEAQASSPKKGRGAAASAQPAQPEEPVAS